MGLEVRRVAADWEHPAESWSGNGLRRRRDERPAYQPDNDWEAWRPLYDKDWLSAYREWLRRGFGLAFTLYVRRPVLLPFVLLGWWRDKPPTPYRYVESWSEWREDRPSWYVGCYRQERWTADDRTHYQLYETVSEGTPLSPPCATIDELSAWCAEQTEAGRNVWVDDAGTTREQWDRFFERGGFAMSAIVTPERGFETGFEYASRDAG